MISVIIPTWNREKLITKAILSVLKQSSKDIEVLVCDDGSTDNSKITVNNISKHDVRVRWIEGIHSGGPATPRNNGILHSRGSWIAFLDSDDRWDENKLEMQLSYAINNYYDLVCSNANKINGKSITKYFNSQNRKLSFKDLLDDNKIICSSVLVKKSVITEVGGFPEDKKYIAIEDYLTWLKIASRHNIGYMDDALVYYNDQPELTIRSRWPDSKVQKFESLKYITNWLKSNPRISLGYLRDLYEVRKHMRSISI